MYQTKHTTVQFASLPWNLQGSCMPGPDSVTFFLSTLASMNPVWSWGMLTRWRIALAAEQVWIFVMECDVSWLEGSNLEDLEVGGKCMMRVTWTSMKTYLPALRPLYHSQYASELGLQLSYHEAAAAVMPYHKLFNIGDRNVVQCIIQIYITLCNELQCNRI